MGLITKSIEFYTEVIFPIIIIGNCFYLVSKIFLKKFYTKHNRDISYQITSRNIIISCGIVYIISFIFLTFIRLNENGELGQMYHSRIFGKYWFGYFTFPILYSFIIVISHFNFKIKNIILLIVSILAIFPIEKYIISFALHRDYLPSSNTNRFYQLFDIWKEIIRNYTLCFVVYIVLLEVIHQLRTYKAKIYNS